jgi:hypothetical protein
MDENTNIVTLRTLNNGARIVEINGRELPYMIQFDASPVDPENWFVNIQFHAGQVNFVKHGNDMPLNTGNPRADKYHKVIAQCFTILRSARWWELPRSVKQVLTLLESVK